MTNTLKTAKKLRTILKTEEISGFDKEILRRYKSNVFTSLNVMNKLYAYAKDNNNKELAKAVKNVEVSLDKVLRIIQQDLL